MNEMKTKSKSQLSWGTKIGFGVGTAGDSIPYYLFFTYFLFFLTDVAGVSAAVAGVISFLAVAWDAITDPIVGYLSDNSQNPRGRRRPFMFKAIIGEAIVVFLLFCPNGLGGGIQVAYYILVALLLWTVYTCFAIPWLALSSEMTDDYNERNVIAMCVGLIAYPFMFLCNSGPMYLQGWLLPQGVSESTCWMIVGIAGACLILLFGGICIRATKGKESINRPERLEEIKNKAKENIFATYKKVLQLKVYRYLLVMGFLFLMGYMLCETTMVYVLSYNAGMTEVQQGLFWTVTTVVAIIATPVCVAIANKTSKKLAFGIFAALLAAACLFFYITKIDNLVEGYIYGVIVIFASTAFYSLFFPMIYDCNEIYEYKFGERNEGAVIAFAQFIQKFGAAVASLVAGLCLEFAGYTGQEVPSEAVLNGILMVATLIPAIVVIVCLLILKAYKVNRDNFNALKEAIALRAEGKEYSDEAFKDIV